LGTCIPLRSQRRPRMQQPPLGCVTVLLQPAVPRRAWTRKRGCDTRGVSPPQERRKRRPGGVPQEERRPNPAGGSASGTRSTIRLPARSQPLRSSPAHPRAGCSRSTTTFPTFRSRPPVGSGAQRAERCGRLPPGAVAAPCRTRAREAMVIPTGSTDRARGDRCGGGRRAGVGRRAGHGQGRRRRRSIIRAVDPAWFRDASVRAELVHPAAEDMFR